MERCRANFEEESDERQCCAGERQPGGAGIGVDGFGDGAEVAILELVDYATGTATKSTAKNVKAKKSPAPRKKAAGKKEAPAKTEAKAEAK